MAEKVERRRAAILGADVGGCSRLMAAAELGVRYGLGATAQRSGDKLHPSGKVYTPWGNTIVPLAESAMLKEKTP